MLCIDYVCMSSGQWGPREWKASVEWLCLSWLSEKMERRENQEGKGWGVKYSLDWKRVLVSEYSKWRKKNKASPEYYTCRSWGAVRKDSRSCWCVQIGTEEKISCTHWAKSAWHLWEGLNSNCQDFTSVMPFLYLFVKRDTECKGRQGVVWVIGNRGC